MTEKKGKPQGEQKPPVDDVNRDPDYLERIFQERTTSLAEGKPPPLPRREITFVMDAASCSPGVFPQDFEITLRGLTSGQELSAARESQGDAASLAYAMARMSVAAVNGKPLGKARREWFWEALGPGGRNVVTTFLTHVQMPDEGATGKAEDTLKVSG